MQKPQVPFDETARLMSLHSLRLLDTPSEERFDRITRMAQRLFGVESSLVSLVDSDRQWFKSKQGLDACETSREISFCGHAILAPDVFVVEDASLDLRFSDNPLVTGRPNIRFYAGCPISGPHAQRIGTLCLLDSQPRSEFTSEDRETLKDLAMMVEDELKMAAQVTKDELTEIANRHGFNLVASHMLSLCRRTGISAELLFFDLDHFKQINDSLGHAAGDSILKFFAKLLIKCFRSADVVARMGGDEFVVLLTATSRQSVKSLDRLAMMAQEERDPILQKLAWSVGTISFDPARHRTVENLLNDADTLMYEDKARRRKTAS